MKVEVELVVMLLKVLLQELEVMEEWEVVVKATMEKK